MQGGSTPTRGAFVVVVGPDGAGKTTLARALMAAYPGTAWYFHFRPPLRGGLAAEPDPEAAPSPKAVPRGGVAAGWLRLAYNYVRCWAGYVASVRPAVRRGSLVVGDRWSYGYLVQPRPLGFRGPRRLAALMVRGLPRPDLVVNVTAEPALILARKSELSRAEIERELAAWRAIPVARLLTVDGAEPPGESAAGVLRRLRPPIR